MPELPHVVGARAGRAGRGMGGVVVKTSEFLRRVASYLEIPGRPPYVDVAIEELRYIARSIELEASPAMLPTPEVMALLARIGEVDS